MKEIDEIAITDFCTRYAIFVEVTTNESLYLKYKFVAILRPVCL